MDFTPLSRLTCFNKGKLTILVKVSLIHPLRSFSQGAGTGHVFSFNAIDAAGTQIKISGFGETAQRFHDLIKEGHAYTITNFTTKMANPQFDTTGNDYEIVLRNESTAEPFFGPQADEISVVSGNFQSLSSLVQSRPKELVDVVCVVKSIGEVTRVTSSKLNKEISKVDCRVVDDSNPCGFELELTVWGSNVEKILSYKIGEVLFIIGARVTFFRDSVSISSISSTKFYKDDAHQRATELSAWVSNIDMDKVVAQKAMQGEEGNKKDIAMIHLEQVPYLQSPCTFKTIGVVQQIRPMSNDAEADLWYLSCPDCKKKMNGDVCDKCGMEKEPLPRFMARVLVSDSTEGAFCPAFDQIVETLVGHSATDLKQMKASSEDQYEDVLKQCYLKLYTFTLSLRFDVYQGQRRPRLSIVNVDHVDWIRDTMQYYQQFVQPFA
ncbi:hypothetical protein P9112_006780 [Eukaryota sp. TZLM1-RC]